MRHLALAVADEPALAYATTVALNSADPDVEQLRLEIGRHIHKLFVAAAGEETDRRTIRLLEFLYTGAMVQVGAGRFSYAMIADELEAAAHRLLA